MVEKKEDNKNSNTQDKKENSKNSNIKDKNWEEKFKKMAENEDDQLLMNDVFDDENFEEWM